MENFKKIDREYCLGDSSVNVYGYRLLTTGFRQDLYEKNPIGFNMHAGREKGVLLRWEDLRVEGDKIYGKPVVNLMHPDGERTAKEIEGGFLNAASMGKIVCLKASDDPKLKLEGQTGATVTEWYPREISLVDIPGNHNALANLYDADDNELDLADFVKPKPKNKMSKITVTPAMLQMVDLADNTPEDVFFTKLQDLVDTAAKVPGLEKDLADKTTELTAKEQELQNVKKAATDKEVADLVDKGITDKKLTVELGEKLKKSFDGRPTELKDLVDAMPVQASIVPELDNDIPEKYVGKTWQDLYDSEELEEVKEKFPNLFEKLVTEKNNPKN